MSEQRDLRLAEALTVLETEDARRVAKDLAKQYEAWSIFWDEEERTVMLESGEGASITIA